MQAASTERRLWQWGWWLHLRFLVSVFAGFGLGLRVFTWRTNPLTAARPRSHSHTRSVQRNGTKRTIACFDCRLQLSCRCRSHSQWLCLPRHVLRWLCTCDNIFIIFASFFAVFAVVIGSDNGIGIGASPTVGACVNINFSRRFNPDYPLTVKFFTQKLPRCFPSVFVLRFY